MNRRHRLVVFGHNAYLGWSLTIFVVVMGLVVWRHH